MTEEEAKQKWCPMVRVSVFPTSTGGKLWSNNRQDLEHRNGSKCLGSACMMWRWHGPYSDRTGHCGLAGRP